MDQLTDMGSQFVAWLIALLSDWGYLIVLVGTTLENIFVVGSFTPGELLVIAASAVAYRGGLLVGAVWLTSVVGTVTGSNIGYWIGRRQGSAALERLTTIMRVKAMRVDAAEEYFLEHGAKTVLLARFATGVKNFVPLIAGVGRMSLWWFEFYTLLGAVIYTSLMVALGWYLGANIDKAISVASSIGWFGALLFISFVTLIWWGRRRRRSAREREWLEDAGERATEEDAS